MKTVIGVMGSAEMDSTEVAHRARILGQAVARRGGAVLTGATTGYSHEAALGAAEEGGMTLGVSPALNREAHAAISYPFEPFDVILYSGFGYKGRNVLNVRGCDGVLFVAGATGTLNELTIAHDEGKVMGVLTGSGGLSDRFREILDLSPKPTGSIAFYDPDPEVLVEAVWNEVLRRRKG